MAQRWGHYQGVRYRGKRRPNYLLRTVAALPVLAIILFSALLLRPDREEPPSDSSLSRLPDISVISPGQSATEPQRPPEPRPDPEPAVENTGYFELPVEGTHGIALVDLRISADETGGERTGAAPAGTAFTILADREERVLARFQDGTQGWVAKDCIMVNLPDLIPSILYRDSNAERSLMKNLGSDLEGITGQVLYEAKAYNKKLEREEYIMPVQYHMARKLMDAQQLAREQNLTLVLYEGFRPYDTQTAVANSLKGLAAENPDTRASIQKNGFNISYYINTELSSHQTGSAVDVSLAQVDRWEERSYHGNTASVPEAYSEFSYGEILTGGQEGVQFSSKAKYRSQLPEDTRRWMPTPMHELSYLSGAFTGPTATYTPSAWKTALEQGKVQHAVYWTAGAQTLQDIFVAAGMEPLASEWWHFNDIEARSTAKKAGATGRFQVGTQSCSLSPAEAVAYLP